MAAIGTPERTEKDRHMIDNPDLWPLMQLPLKQPPKEGYGFPRLGWLSTGMEWTSDERVVHLGTVYDGASSAETETYPNTQTLLDAGWTVD